VQALRARLERSKLLPDLRANSLDFLDIYKSQKIWKTAGGFNTKLVGAGCNGQYYGHASTVSDSRQHAATPRIISWTSDGTGTASHEWTSTGNDAWHARRTTSYPRWSFGQWNATWSGYSSSRWAYSECARDGTLRTTSTDVSATSGNALPESLSASAATTATAKTKTAADSDASAATPAAPAAATPATATATTWWHDEQSERSTDQPGSSSTNAGTEYPDAVTYASAAATPSSAS
jgi:hypothetical protein